MLGESLLVAPVLDCGAAARKVWLPAWESGWAVSPFRLELTASVAANRRWDQFLMVASEPRPRPSTTWRWMGATAVLTASEPKGWPTTTRSGRWPLAVATSFTIASATSCGLGASFEENMPMKVSNILAGMAPISP
ncbi:hypothetical protein [Bosea vaviloviae]|uniref:hypothetical protein n=1 Tax=Bosea vaviloviae TaxID=1526658 RepID=UPI003D7F7599